MGSHEADRPRVLVIDDEPKIRELVCEAMRVLGFDADGAATGVEGLALAEQRRYDLVVTDLMMPGLSGWDVAEAVRRRAPACGVILATGSVGELDLDRIQRLSLTLLRKPFTMSALKVAAEQTLGRALGVPTATPAEGRAEEAAGAVADASAAVLGTLRSVVADLREAGARLESAVEAVEALARDRDALTEQRRRLLEERNAVVREVEAVARRLRARAGGPEGPSSPS